ncbi:histidinol-phosphate aminotransferase [Ignicoccus islandicus DSM 13165]|uniref:Histidinol-phosphate aminotransferase n=1 Tax=Ignicoccus islandicus DSM 13165 TaxID=940295 RepID=A0A0U2WLD4_9CREN|nr:histidinol-phosphate transaminase [Ignicoccus islandicus]ALU11745.1 histidinol-phosphate aminotransferase [Ignicoccus islandicus DSM 13165]
MECNKRKWLSLLKAYKLPEKPPRVKARLHLNENPYPPPREVVEAAYEAVKHGNLYPDPERYFLLRELAANFYSLPGPEWILPTLGSDTALKLFFEVCALGSNAVFPSPSFQAYPHLASTSNTTMVYSNLIEGEDDFELDLNDFLSKDAEAAVIDSPNNPTGSILINEDDLEKLSKKFKVVLIDEAYAEFKPKELTKLVTNHENILFTRTMSKVFGLAGFRVGFLIGNPEYIEEISKLLLPYDMPSPSVEAAISALRHSNYINDYLSYVEKEKERLYEVVRSLGWKPFKSYTNFVLVKTNVKDIVNKFKEKGVMVRGVPLGNEWFRVSIGKPEEMETFYEVAEEISSHLPS